MAPKIVRKKISTREKIVPTVSLRKKLNDEREDPSHLNYNNPPRIPAKRVKTCSTRVPVRNSSISGSVPRVSVAPEEDSSQDSSAAESNSSDSQGTPTTQSSTDFFVEHEKFPSAEVPQPENFHNATLEQQRTTTAEEEVLVGDINSEQGAGKYRPRDPSMLTSFATHRAKVLVLGQGISLSLKKIIDFFAGKVGTNAPQTASSSSSPIKLSSRMVGKAYMLYVLGSFLFPTKKGTDVSVKYLSFFQDNDVNKPWSWGAATLAHLYYSLGASSRVNAKWLACCTTLLESWIFEHFSKLPGIPSPNQSGAAELCTRWSWTKTTSALSGSAALNMFREALDSYKLQDVVLDPYLEKREDKYNFKEVASFTGLLCTPEHNKLYYPDRVQRQFNRRQPVPRAPTCVEQSGLRLCDEPCAYKPKYNWVDLFSEGKWRDSIILTRGRKVHDGISVCTEGYFNGSIQFPSPNFSPMLLILPKMTIAMMREYWGIGVVFPRGRMRVEVPHSQNEGGGGPAEVVEDPARSVLVEALATKTLECESNKKLVEYLRMQLANKVKENETLSSINNKLMEEVYVNQEARPLPLNLVSHSEENVIEAEMWKLKYEELNVKFEEAQRRLSDRDRNGEYEDDIILSGREEYQERIDSRLKKIDHKTNLRQTLFQPFNWFQLDIRDVERDGNTAFRVAATYAYPSQMKFLNVNDSLCTLMMKKPSYWKNIFSQRLDVVYSDLGERSKQQDYKEKRFENILADSTKYWWVGMTSHENFVKLKTKYQSPIPPISTLWWAHVQLDIPDALVKPCVKNYFDAPNEAWMKLRRDNNVNLHD
ncbi:hypothetical protein GIB67_042329 [Kingdonia uniflora]|uniref:Aminotransferase-like plant mobile domain-containing protein n=1 Tax=Kingdonia uniflora TaxID=39325 RepID=A0A7J7LE37_9MAGN|nr:hypothetical protein GIB67_042329 [Kingdonia uniflora]